MSKKHKKNRSKKTQTDSGKNNVSYSRYFTKNGKTYDAWDYGHKAWPIGKS